MLLTGRAGLPAGTGAAKWKGWTTCGCRHCCVRGVQGRGHWAVAKGAVDKSQGRGHWAVAKGAVDKSQGRGHWAVAKGAVDKSQGRGHWAVAKGAVDKSQGRGHWAVANVGCSQRSSGQVSG